jgi:hypothetical protein
MARFVCPCIRAINDQPPACGLICLPMDDGVRANPLTPKSRKKLPNKAMHLSRAGMFLMPVISLVHQLLRPGDGQRWEAGNLLQRAHGAMGLGDCTVGSWVFYTDPVSPAKIPPSFRKFGGLVTSDDP